MTRCTTNLCYWSSRTTHTRPVVITFFTQVVCPFVHRTYIRPSVPTFQKQAKQNKSPLSGVLRVGLGDHCLSSPNLICTCIKIMLFLLVLSSLLVEGTWREPSTNTMIMSWKAGGSSWSRKRDVEVVPDPGVDLRADHDPGRIPGVHPEASHDPDLVPDPGPEIAMTSEVVAGPAVVPNPVQDPLRDRQEETMTNHVKKKSHPGSVQDPGPAVDPVMRRRKRSLRRMIMKKYKEKKMRL